MSRKPKAARDPNSVVPFVVSGIIILVTGVTSGYLLDRTSLPEASDQASALIIVGSIIISGVLFIAAWAKRQ